MKKVFLDTNVILDFYLDREEFSDDAEATPVRDKITIICM